VRYHRALLLVALTAAPAIHAETLYVIEQLVVNVNSAPDASGERVATIKSGEAVEVLDRQGDQIHVHLTNGSEGWVRKSYLSADEPLQHRLAERNAEVEKLKQDVARLEGDLAAARAGGRGGKAGAVPGNAAVASGPRANTNVTAPAAAASQTNPAATAASQTNAPAAPTATKAPSAPPAAAAPGPAGTAPATSETNTVNTAVDPAAGEPAYFMTPPESPARPVWHWAVGSFVVALGLGYALGWYVLDRRIRRKYGGLRIY
jgi:SH3 domain-containing protein